MVRRAALVVMFLVTARVSADPLPRVTEADWTKVSRRCQQLVDALKKHPGALPPDVEQRLVALLKAEPKDADEALDKLQDLLDPLCLVGVNINPESRVKAARGSASADLRLNQPRIVLLKVQNEGGITPPLNVSGDEVRQANKIEPGRWLEVTPLDVPALKSLSGVKLEYVAFRLTAREAGKREATLKFDAGQGTQDLGFRAEVPILFKVLR